MTNEEDFYLLKLGGEMAGTAGCSCVIIRNCK
jgi:hypothetical protein